MKKLIFLFTTLAITITALAQDIIVTKDSKKIEAKITEVSKSEIKYKEFDYQDGPTFILGIDEIATIAYGNGKVVVYNQQKSVEELAHERNLREERARQLAELEQNDIDAQGRVKEEEERTRQAEAIAKANQLGTFFGNSGNANSSRDSQGVKNPFGHGSSGGNNWALSGRNLKGMLPQPYNTFNQEGRVIVQILVDAAGNVIQATHKGGTITDRQTIQLALDAAKKAKFSRGEEEQIGTITYNFKFN